MVTFKLLIIRAFEYIQKLHDVPRVRYQMKINEAGKTSTILSDLPPSLPWPLSVVHVHEHKQSLKILINC